MFASLPLAREPLSFATCINQCVRGDDRTKVWIGHMMKTNPCLATRPSCQGQWPYQAGRVGIHPSQGF